MVKKIALLLAAVGVVLFGAGAPAQAQDGYPAGSELALTVTIQIGPPGFEFTAIVNGCFPTEIVEFVFNGGAPVSTVCNASFQASAPFTAPLEIGTYTITATLLGPPAAPQPLAQGFGAVPQQLGERPVVLTDTVQVIDDSTTTTAPAGQIPETGASGVNTNLAIGGILLLAGAGLVTVAAIRRRDTASAS